MKQFLFLAAAATMLFAGCQKTEVVYDNPEAQEIAVFAVNQTMTKGAETTFPTTWPMKVSAYLASGDGATAGEYFANKTFNHANYVWTGGQYWPLSTSTINFFALAPEISSTEENNTFSVTTTFNEISGNNKTATTTVTGNATKQYDVMYALGQGTHTAGQEYQNVSMAFNHALSWINFTVKAGAATPTIKVNSITLNNAYFDGTATFTATETNYTSTSADNVKTANVNPTWAVAENTSDIKVPYTEPISLTTNAQNVPNGLLVVPNTYNQSGDKKLSFTINYTITQDSKNFTYNYTHTLPETTWAHGTKYTYAITITLQEIKITSSVNNWTEGSSTDANLTK